MVFLIRFDLERSARPGLRGQAPAFLKLALVALDTGSAYREALGHRVDRSALFLQGIHNTLPKIH